ncbi:hypothetical protein Pla144_14520 [Bythopirellula polymerisocia]|uniref:Uncharacterized protein n=1 Tax=Bythopirellula polymerisocia TaxID=2528003 RepID=A0A5C6CWC9_9BACT|nr:hypothetical protein Pla144_14520 [Bythopirellula polymerisocia]
MSKKNNLLQARMLQLFYVIACQFVQLVLFTASIRHLDG